MISPKNHYSHKDPELRLVFPIQAAYSWFAQWKSPIPIIDTKRSVSNEKSETKRAIKNTPGEPSSIQNEKISRLYQHNPILYQQYPRPSRHNTMFSCLCPSEPRHNPIVSCLCPTVPRHNARVSCLCPTVPRHNAKTSCLCPTTPRHNAKVSCLCPIDGRQITPEHRQKPACPPLSHGAYRQIYCRHQHNTTRPYPNSKRNEAIHQHPEGAQAKGQNGMRNKPVQELVLKLYSAKKSTHTRRSAGILNKFSNV